MTVDELLDLPVFDKVRNNRIIKDALSENELSIRVDQIKLKKNTLIKRNKY
jgi:hypothetical protein